MSILAGELTSYNDYLSATLRPQERPTLWPWDAVRAALAAQAGSSQGSLALSRRDAEDRSTLAPGLSLVVQTVAPGEATSPHRHSFWHVYFVSSGHGSIRTGTAPDEAPLHPGDVLFVPAWCLHAVDNRTGAEDLVLLRLQNLPQNAAAGTLMREDQQGHAVPLFQAASDDESVRPCNIAEAET